MGVNDAPIVLEVRGVTRTYNFRNEVEMAHHGVRFEDRWAQLTERIEALKTMRDIYQNGMSDEVFAWTAASNNQAFLAGRLSVALNAISIALFVAAEQAPACVEIARAQGVDAIVAGRVEAGPKRLLVEPLQLEYGSDELQLR